MANPDAPAFLTTHQRMMTRIEVTQEDIDLGTQRCGLNCAIARAVNRVVKPDTRVEVVSYCVFLNATTVLWGEDQRAKIRDFISDFDMRRSSVKPFEFELEIPFEFEREEEAPPQEAKRIPLVDPATLLAVA